MKTDKKIEEIKKSLIKGGFVRSDDVEEMFEIYVNPLVQKAVEDGVRGFAKWYNLYVQQVDVKDDLDATLVSNMYIRKYAIETYLQTLKENKE